MYAKQKLLSLTNSWYGYALFSAIVSVFTLRASGIFAYAIGFVFSAVISAVMLVVWLAWITWAGRRLVARSTGTRSFLVFVSGLFTLLGVIATVSSAWTLVRDFSIPGIASMVLMAAYTMMNARSFNVLTDKSVKSYFV